MTVQGFKFAVLSAAVVSAAGFAGTAHAAVVFSDTFGGGSNINNASPSTPSGSSTSYEVVSTKNDTGTSASSIAANDLALKQVATTSGVTEVQALFTAGSTSANPPVTLATAGDTVDYQVTFVPTNVGLSTNADTLYFGIYNAGQSAPASNLQNAGLSATATSAVTGFAQNWAGYVSQLMPASTTSTGKLVTRLAQSSANNSNQDLVANGASGGTYNTPVGSQVGATLANAGAAGLASGSTYTEDFIITLNSDGSQTLTSTLYSGAGISGTAVDVITGSIATPIASIFDGLAFGFRHSGTSGAAQLDLSSLSVAFTPGTTTATPEPASMGLLATGALALLARRRRAGVLKFSE